MEYLPKEIRRKGFIYNLERRGEKSLIYSQTDVEDNYIVAYEVFRIRVDKPKVVFGIELGEREVFPANEDFGKWAWTYPTLERAEKAYRELENSTPE